MSFWDELEALLLAQQRAGSTIDSVVKVGPGKEDKVIVKGRAGAFKVVPRGLAQHMGMLESHGHASITDAVAAASTSASARGLHPISVRFGHGKAPTTGPVAVKAARHPVTEAVPGPPRVRPVAVQPAASTAPPVPGAEAFVAFARGQLHDILDVSGQVLYSGASTLRQGEVYLLGFNPGGDPSNPELLTIRQSLDRLVSNELAPGGVPMSEWNSYVHATWKGRDTLQRRILWLLTRLSLDPLTVVASNLVFPRSRGEESLETDAYADICWAVHEWVLGIVRPRLVLTYGNTPYRFLSERFGARDEQRCAAGHGDWQCRSFVVPGRFRVVGVPHMSLYAIDHHDEVIDWIRGL